MPPFLFICFTRDTALCKEEASAMAVISADADDMICVRRKD